MKLLRGTLRSSGYRVSCLVDPEDLDLLRFEDTGEIPEGLDFALLWKGVWREGRCYASFAGRTFVTYGDAQRLSLRAGMQTRRPNYVLEPECLLELASTYARELGYTSTRPGEIVDVNTTIEAGESAEVAIPTENGQPSVVIIISLYSNGDIRLLASDELFLATPPFNPEDLLG
jgi:hypothetical protein